MKILVINSGSTSVKYKLFSALGMTEISSGIVENIDTKSGGHDKAIRDIIKQMGKHQNDIVGIGHRVVHGGEKYKTSIIATEEILKGVAEVSVFAPLHNGANLAGVRACMTAMLNIPNVLVFDTAFHSDMPPSSFLYAIPLENYKKHGIRRYGFHGTSYKHVATRTAEIYGKPLEKLRIIALHLGGGASVCAIQNGHSVDTSMGLTPLEGLVMGTRSGDIDVGAVIHLAKVKGLTLDSALDYLNKESGIAGLSESGESCFRTVQKFATENHAEFGEGANHAIDLFVNRIVKYIGAYAASMGGVDAIVWTGGIGVNNVATRRRVSEKLGFMGVHVGEYENEVQELENGFKEITDGEYLRNYSKANGTRYGRKTDGGGGVRSFVIETNEEIEIAKDVKNLLKV